MKPSQNPPAPRSPDPLQTFISYAWIDLTEWQSLFRDYRAAGVVGPLVPDEVILAKGFQPVRLFYENISPGNPGPASPDSKPKSVLLPSFVCLQARTLVNAACTLDLPGFEELVISQSCDALQAAADLIQACDRAKSGTGRIVFLKTPQVLSGRAPAVFYTRELEKYLGKTAIEHACQQASFRRKLLRRLYHCISAYTFYEFYSVLRALCILPYDEGSKLLEALLDSGGEKARSSAGAESLLQVILCGTHLPGRDVLDALDSAGLAPAGDLLDPGWCTVSSEPETTMPIDLSGITRNTIGRIPPMGKHSENCSRAEAVRTLIRSTGASGVVWYRLPFCDPGGFDFAVSRNQGEAGVPTLCIDYEASSDSGRIGTRLEAFAEMLREGR